MEEPSLKKRMSTGTVLPPEWLDPTLAPEEATGDESFIRENPCKRGRCVEPNFPVLVDFDGGTAEVDFTDKSLSREEFPARALLSCDTTDALKSF